MSMTTPLYYGVSKEDRRQQAVLALFRGEKASDMSATFGIARSDLYKFYNRALAAMREALKDHPRGPRQPRNRLGHETEQKAMAVCQRHPTYSSYQIQENLGSDAPCARTIQRVRARHRIARVLKRAPPSAPAARLSEPIMERARYFLKKRPHLGPVRVMWDLQNGEQLQIRTSTVKRLKRKIHDALHLAPPQPSLPVSRFYERHHPHNLWHGDFMDKITLTDTKETVHQLTLQDDYSRGYVFCDLLLDHDQRTVIRALLAAMRAWQVIPNAVLADNGSPFKGNLIATFCEKLGIRLFHTAVRHPQTNGKLERAFQDDMWDFYRQYSAMSGCWIIGATINLGTSTTATISAGIKR